MDWTKPISSKMPAPARVVSLWRRVTTGGPYFNEAFNQTILTFVILAGVLGVAYTDHSVMSFSLASLYLLPLALSALVHPLRVTIALSVLCLILHDYLSPHPTSGFEHVVRNAATLLGYLFVVTAIHQLSAQRRRTSELAERQRDELLHEINLAAEVQQSILPRSIPRIPGFDIAAKMYPAKIVAGDYYGFLDIGEGSVALVIADVAGKGVAAGLLMPSIEVALRLDAQRLRNVSDLLYAFNQVVHQITRGRRFISMFCGKLCMTDGSLQYSNAGHNPPLLIRDEGNPMTLDCGGPVLGVLPEAQYLSDTIVLRPGDILALYTDGLVEAENQNGEEYAKERLAEAIEFHRQASASELLDMVRQSVASFCGTSNQFDDITLIIVKRL
jgi:serine phosphatase RsbU (regulator of sigma subunit)